MKEIKLFCCCVRTMGVLYRFMIQHVCLPELFIVRFMLHGACSRCRYFYISQSLRLCAKGTIYIFLCFFITAVSTLHLFAQTPADKIDFNVIDQYITAKMQAPPRIPGVALAIVKGDQMFDLAILALTVILIISLMRISKQYKPDLVIGLKP